MGDIDEFWVINEGGLCLYTISVENESNLDPGLFGGFVTAIDQFGENLSNDRIQKLNFGLTVKSNEKKLRKILDEIERKFLSKYSDELILDWDGDLSVFEGFYEDVKRLFRGKKRKPK